MLTVSALVFAGLYYFANVTSFWFDELIAVGSIRSELSFNDMLHIYTHEEANAPLYFIFAFFWYRIVPHTERALLSLSILFVILSSIIMGLLGEKLRGIRFGILTFLLILCNRTVIEYAKKFSQYAAGSLSRILMLKFLYLLRLPDLYILCKLRLILMQEKTRIQFF